MQRVALARALLLSPAVIVADEPTASLDGESARIVGELLLAACVEAGSTLLIVTHDRHLLARLDAVYTLAGGRIAAAGSGGAP
jgi:putative ABC transport system ATP-binding protein